MHLVYALELKLEDLGHNNSHQGLLNKCLDTPHTILILFILIGPTGPTHTLHHDTIYTTLLLKE